MTSKRPRVSLSTPSPSSPTSSRSASPEPTPKALRTSRSSAGTGHPLLCTLPPTCNHKPTPISNSKDLEMHYATYHAHVCAEPGCSCVFPEPKLLDLHQTECHDPLAAIRQERGEKIFGCLASDCNKVFLTPKTRRLHLIHGHGYPKEFFFGVTNKGVGGLLKKWGEGASMIRGEWKSRDEKTENEGDHDHSDEEEEQQEEDGQSTDEEQENSNPIAPLEDEESEDDLDGLANTMSSLTLVPKSIRFGRGGRGGFVSSGIAVPREVHIRGASRARGGPRGFRGGRGGRGGAHLAQTGSLDESVMDVDVTPAKGRGRGTFFPRGRALRGGFRGMPRGNGGVRGRARGY